MGSARILKGHAAEVVIASHLDVQDVEAPPSAVSMVGDSWPLRNATSITGMSAESASRYHAFSLLPVQLSGLR